MQATSDAGFYFPALIIALTLPDMVAAVGSQNGRASGAKYRSWVQRYLAGHSTPESADQLWGFRCSLLHQGSTSPTGGHSQIVFTPPGVTQMHNFQIGSVRDETRIVAMLSVPMFVNDVATAVDRWINEHGDTNLVLRNLERFVHLRAEGVPDLIAGPVLT